MSGDVFKSPGESFTRWGDKIAALDEKTQVAGGGGLTGIKTTQELGEGFGNWYEGPGGESSTKLGLAAIAAAGIGGTALGYGGESAAAGGTGDPSAAMTGVGSDEGVITQLAVEADPTPILDSVNSIPADTGAADYNWLNDPNSTGNMKQTGGINSGKSGLTPQQMAQLSKMMPKYPTPEYAPAAASPRPRAINLAVQKAPELAMQPMTFAQLLKG